MGSGLEVKFRGQASLKFRGQALLRLMSGNWNLALNLDSQIRPDPN